MKKKVSVMEKFQNYITEIVLLDGVEYPTIFSFTVPRDAEIRSMSFLECLNYLTSDRGDMSHPVIVTDSKDTAAMLASVNSRLSDNHIIVYFEGLYDIDAFAADMIELTRTFKRSDGSTVKADDEPIDGIFTTDEGIIVKSGTHGAPDKAEFKCMSDENTKYSMIKGAAIIAPLSEALQSFSYIQRTKLAELMFLGRDNVCSEGFGDILVYSDKNGDYGILTSGTGKEKADELKTAQYVIGALAGFEEAPTGTLDESLPTIYKGLCKRMESGEVISQSVFEVIERIWVRCQKPTFRMIDTMLEFIKSQEGETSNE